MKSVAWTCTLSGAKEQKCSSACRASAVDQVTYSTCSPSRASTARHSAVVLPDPGRPISSRIGALPSTKVAWSAVHGSPAMSSLRSSAVVRVR